jgi:hypothetical protein
MAARLPSVRITLSLALNCTDAVSSPLTEMWVTLPTSTPATRTKFPLASPLTLLKIAV